MSEAMILIGAPGTGKSSTLDALCTLLEIERIPFSAIESEQFSRGYPWLTLLEWIPQLSAVVSLQRRSGRSRFLVAVTPESDEELSAVRAAVDAERQLVVCLHAAPDTVARRVAAREPDSWPGKAVLVDHARELAVVIPALATIDVVISTEERSALDVAVELKEVLGGRGML